MPYLLLPPQVIILVFLCSRSTCISEQLSKGFLERNKKTKKHVPQLMSNLANREGESERVDIEIIRVDKFY